MKIKMFTLVIHFDGSVQIFIKLSYSSLIVAAHYKIETNVRHPKWGGG